jgi:thiosulfate dehydrogenase [quinone] large subunit
MTITASPRHDRAYRDGAVSVPEARTQTPPIADAAPQAGRTATSVARYAWFAARIGMGFIFLWAFLDKLFGLGYATPAAKGWIDGGNPTKGFLSGAKGPFADFYHNLAGTTFANVAFMTGLAGIGIALLLGIGMRIAAGSGALLMTMMYTVVLPPTTNPVIDDHLILAVLLIGLAAAGAGNFLGLGRWWTGTPLVRRLPWLK